VIRRPVADLALDLHAVALHLVRRVRAVDARLGMSGPRLSVLAVLVFGGPRSLTALASSEQVSTPTMTRLVQALEADGYISRHPDPRDGRAVELRATAKATRLLRKGRERRVEALVSELSDLSTDELEAIDSAVRILQRVEQEAS
jgi:DNA-binding MarR family transcriptional regulator